MLSSKIKLLCTIIAYFSASIAIAAASSLKKSNADQELVLRTSALRGHQRSESKRALQSGLSAFELLLVGVEDSVTVRLRQTLFGDEADCDDEAADSPHETALLMFAIYKQPVDGGDLDCEVYLKKDACWYEDLEIGCDPLTGTATIDLYIRDFKLDRGDVVNNPSVLLYENDPTHICIGPQDKVGFSVKQTATFDCAVVPNEPESSCTEDADCVVGSFCDEVNGVPGRRSTSLGERFCEVYAALGESCGGSGLAGSVARCDPSEAVCTHPYACFGASDFPGTCEAAATIGACTTDSDCSDPLDEYCAFAPELIASRKCSPRRANGECCDPVTTPCTSDFLCGDPFGLGFSTCAPEGVEGPGGFPGPS
jgi:hypothetical protein